MSENKSKTTDRQKRLKATGVLLLTAVLWGSGFVTQKVGAELISPFCYNGWRYLLGALIVMVFTRGKLPFNKNDLPYTCLAGFLLFIAAHAQQAGIKTTSVANAGFITAIYVILVPFISSLFFRTPTKLKNFISAAIATVGLYLLSTSGKPLSSISSGDLIVLAGSVFWALHIITVGKATEKIDPVCFSAGQFLICAVLNLACWLLLDGGDSSNIIEAAPYVIYSGIVVIGGGYTFQAVGQKDADESIAAVILSSESIFASLFGVLLLHETFSLIQLIGAVLIFVSILIAVRE